MKEFVIDVRKVNDPADVPENLPVGTIFRSAYLPDQTYLRVQHGFVNLTHGQLSFHPQKECHTPSLTSSVEIVGKVKIVGA